MAPRTLSFGFLTGKGLAVVFAGAARGRQLTKTLSALLAGEHLRGALCEAGSSVRFCLARPQGTEAGNGGLRTVD